MYEEINELATCGKIDRYIEDEKEIIEFATQSSCEKKLEAVGKDLGACGKDLGNRGKGAWYYVKLIKNNCDNTVRIKIVHEAFSIGLLRALAKVNDLNCKYDDITFTFMKDRELFEAKALVKVSETKNKILELIHLMDKEL